MAMAKYQRRPGIIEAEKSPTPQTIRSGRFQKMFAKAGDWICHANGHTWVVEADVFPLLYEMVKDEPDN